MSTAGINGGEGSINFDPNGIINNVGPIFTLISTELESATTTLSSISIPDDFEYANQLSKMPSRINSSVSSVKGVYSWIIDEVVLPMIEADKKSLGLVKGLSNTTYSTDTLRDILLNGGVAVKLPTETIYVIPKTREAFLQCAAALMRQYATEKWEWKGLGTSGGLVYAGPNCDHTFEDVINNPRKATCCATFVSTALYLAGFVTSKDFYVAGKYFNPNWQNHVFSVCKRLEYEEIREYNELQSGDIMIYWAENGNMSHTDIYLGKNEEGKDLFYSAGFTHGIQKQGGIQTHNLKGMSWAAFRLPEDSNETLYILDNTQTEKENIEISLNTIKDNVIVVNLETNAITNNENNNENNNMNNNENNNESNNMNNNENNNESNNMNNNENNNGSNNTNNNENSNENNNTNNNENNNENNSIDNSVSDNVITTSLSTEVKKDEEKDEKKDEEKDEKKDEEKDDKITVELLLNAEEGKKDI